MNGRKIWCALMALGLGIAAASVSSDALAQAKGKNDKAAPAAVGNPSTAKKDITFDLPGISFGQTVKQVTAAVETMLDADYKPLYAKVSPGVKMKQLDAALAEEKSAFARSIIKFGNIPVALDSGPLKGEYTYNNREAKMELTRKGWTWHLFFIQEKFYKAIVERKLGEKEATGKDFNDAASKVSKDLGIVGRKQAADAAKGRNADEYDWKDAKTHLRLIDRGSSAVAFAYVDSATEASLPSLRTGKQPAGNEIDPAVAGITRKEAAPPGPPDPKKATPTKAAQPVPKK